MSEAATGTHVVSLILPLFVSGSPDCSVEGSLVLSLPNKWVNGELVRNSKYKPDFF